LTFTVKLLANPELCSLRYLSASYRRTPVSSATGTEPHVLWIPACAGMTEREAG
jgi:hypothetical protein